MFNTYKKLLASSKGKYLLVGITVYLLEVAVITALDRGGFSSVVAVSAGFWLGLVTSFLLQKFYTFKDPRTRTKIVASQIFAVGLLVIFNYSFTVGLAAVFAEVNPTLVRTVALVITTTWNYYVYKTHIFNRKIKPRKLKLAKTWKSFAKKPGVHRLYAIAAGLVLLVSTAIWSVLGAQIHASNADQLVDPLLFENQSTFQAAQFPGTHTFLMKWPLFLLVKTWGFTPTAYVTVTVVASVITVLAIAYLLYRINRRSLIYGTLFLALASVLMLVPAQPYAGALLPVNFAMLATRNLEYVLYIVSLVGICKTISLRSKPFIFAVFGLTVLFASDKLFLTFSLGGATALVFIYGYLQRWKIVTLAINWFIGSIIAAVLSATMLLGLDHFNVTGIVNSDGASPYALVSDPKQGVLGLIYTAGGIMTNFGANPAYDATELANVPARTADNLFSSAALGYLINVAILAGAVVAALSFLRRSIGKRTSNDAMKDTAGRLSLLLIGSSAVAVCSFIAVEHYYAVDARYLTLCLLTGLIVLAWFSRRLKIKPTWLLGAGGLMVIGLAFSGPQLVERSTEAQTILRVTERRNDTVRQALVKLNVNTLVGDYWRVVPIKASQPQLTAQPLANCTEPRDTLTSTRWNKSLMGQSFAYLLSLDDALTDFPKCSLEQVLAAYGRPTNSLIIDGSLESPKELLLLYENGRQPTAAAAIEPGPISELNVPIDIATLPATSCKGQTVMNIVAHQDDDLLFINPDLLRSLRAGSCVRTVYLTAGDGGNGQDYWISRQLGVQAAYATMMKQSNNWVLRTVRINSNAKITVSSLKGSSQVSLVFMNLPDGNLQGDGFASANNESLRKLRDGAIPIANSVDGLSSLTAQSLVDILSRLMQTYRPIEIRTQAESPAEFFVDHSDHTSVRWFVDRALIKYWRDIADRKQPIATKYYVGYPIRERLPNVFDEDYQLKQAAFLAYARHDGSVCNSPEDCQASPTYGSYLSRQYQLGQ